MVLAAEAEAVANNLQKYMRITPEDRDIVYKERRFRLIDVDADFYLDLLRYRAQESDYLVTYEGIPQDAFVVSVNNDVNRPFTVTLTIGSMQFGPLRPGWTAPHQWITLTSHYRPPVIDADEEAETVIGQMPA